HPTENPAECSGPPHLLGPWGSAGLGAVWSGLLKATASGRPPAPVPKIELESGELARETCAGARLLDPGFAEFHVLLRDRIVFLLHQLGGHGARILLGHVIEAGVGARHELDLDGGGLGHDGPREFRRNVAGEGGKSRWP